MGGIAAPEFRASYSRNYKTDIVRLDQTAILIHPSHPSN